MYYPYFRGKQFELITIRECAGLLAASNFVPIIEPVRAQLRGLEKALDAVCEAGGNAIVIVNPYYGDHSEDSLKLSEFVSRKCSSNDLMSAGILLRNEMSIENALALCDEYADHKPALIHAGFTEPKALAEGLRNRGIDPLHVFIEDHAQFLYRKHFVGSRRVLVRDGFVRRRNADYSFIEEFTELHLTYKDLGMSGFGDFLIVGDDYSETGGPAYAVAIHLTFIDPDKDDVMHVYHFVSDTRDTPTDPAGKFAQALRKLISKLNSGQSKLLETQAIARFRELNADERFPGLGYVKKLSMQHHIETLANFLE